MSQPTETNPQPSRPFRLRGLLLATGLVVVLGAGAVLYGSQTSGKEGAGSCPGTAARAASLDPLIHGEVAALNLAKTPRLMPDISFQGPDGAPKTLADFRGKTVLLNLWATWCIPCRKEMPALDRLQAERGGPDFQVVAVNIDTAKLDRPKQFLADIGIKALPFYADPTAKVFQTLRTDASVLGLPTTFLVDKNGCALATMAGPAEWSSADAAKVVDAAAKS